MTAMRSEAAFKEKLREFGLEGSWHAFTGKGWRSVGAFAMSCGFNPESVTDAVLSERVIRKICAWDGRGDEPLLANNIRQLFWDCVQCFLADTRNRYANRPEEYVEHFSEPERHLRRENIRTKMEKNIPNIMRGPLEPAHCIDDDLYEMSTRNMLTTWIQPSDCPHRKQEMETAVLHSRSRGKHPKSEGSENWNQQPSRPAADISEVHLLELAFKRRGLSFEIVGFMSFAAHESW